jgi:hypothetical protein
VKNTAEIQQGSFQGGSLQKDTPDGHLSPVGGSGVEYMLYLPLGCDEMNEPLIFACCTLCYGQLWPRVLLYDTLSGLKTLIIDEGVFCLKNELSWPDAYSI